MSKKLALAFLLLSELILSLPISLAFTVATASSSDSQPTSGFGVSCQYYKAEEAAAYHPDMWTLVDHIGATHVKGVVRRGIADGCRDRGLKLLAHYAAPPNTLAEMDPCFQSKAALKAHLDRYNIAQYRNHDGIYAHVLTHEPCGNEQFDPRNPPQEVLNLIEVLKYGVEYIKTLDPTHPVTVSLNTAGAHGYDGLWIEKRKAWINLFIDWVDILDYHLYLNGAAGAECWRDWDKMRSRLGTMLDQVLIPCSKGKPIIIGETGCPSPSFIDWKGEYAYYTEEQQAEYFWIFGEYTRPRGIFVYAFKLIDPTPTASIEGGYGLFTSEKGAVRNVEKKAASLVKSYLSISTSTTPTPTTPTATPTPTAAPTTPPTSTPPSTTTPSPAPSPPVPEYLASAIITALAIAVIVLLLRRPNKQPPPPPP